MEEFEAYRKLVEKAQEQLGDFVTVSLQPGGWSVIKEGSLSEDLRHGTFEQAVAKLKEWGTPQKPVSVTIENIPYSHVEWYARNGSNPGFKRLCQEAVAPYEPQ